MKNEKKSIILFGILLLFSLTFVSASYGYDDSNLGYGYNDIEQTETIINYINATNHSEYWDTDEGVLDNVADITYDMISGGDVNALGYF